MTRRCWRCRRTGRWWRRSTRWWRGCTSAATGRGRRVRTREALRAAHHRPRPRLEAARALAASGHVTAMMDLSDGIASDVRHLAGRSGVGARVWRGALPVSKAAHAVAPLLGVDPTDWALYVGEDYELLFTVASSPLDPVRELLRPLGVPIAGGGE